MPDNNKDKNNESSKKAAGMLAKGALDYYTDGKGGEVYDKAKKIPLAGKAIDKYEGKVAKYADKKTKGAFSKLAGKADDVGALDLADSAMSMGKSSSKSKTPNESPNKNNVGKNILNNNDAISKPGSSELDKEKKNNNIKQQQNKERNAKRRIQSMLEMGSQAAREKAEYDGETNNKEQSSIGNDDKEKKNKNGKKNDSILNFSGSMSLQVKLILAGAIGFILFIMIVSIILTSYFNNFLDLIGVGSAGKAAIVEAANSKSYNELYKRVLKHQKEDAENGKSYDADKVIAVYHILAQYNKDFKPKDADDSWIDEVVSLMFPSDCGESCSYDEATFKDNLENIFFPKYLEGKMNCGGADNLIAIAEKEIGNNEGNGSHAKYLSFLGFGSGSPWCAAFVSWVANKAGVDEKIIPHTASVSSFLEYFKLAGTFRDISSYKPKPNDLIIWKANGRSHIGIVKSLSGDTLKTIEGNTSNAVAERTYSFSSLAGRGVVGFAAVGGESNGTTCTDDDSEAATIKNGQTIKLPSGLGTIATREFDLAVTASEIAYARQQIKCCHHIVNPYAYPEGYDERKVQDLWIKEGHKHDKKGFCKLKGRYLIAATNTFGKIGDKVDFYMSGGKIIKVILIDSKSQEKTWYDQHPADKWGHDNGACVLEFLGKNSIGNDPYGVLGLKGQTVVKAVNGGSAIK